MKIRIGIGIGTQSFPSDGAFSSSARRWSASASTRSGFPSVSAGPAYDPIVSLSFVAGGTRSSSWAPVCWCCPAEPRDSGQGTRNARSSLQWSAHSSDGPGRGNPIEHQAFRVQRTERSSIFDESLPLLRRFWSEDHVTHHGQHFDFEDVTIQPKPIQQLPDVWLGGMAPSELRRTGRVGDGWLPSTCTPTEAAAGRDAIDEAAGRPGDPSNRSISAPASPMSRTRSRITWQSA